MPLIELNSISKIYDTGTLKVASIDGIDFSVEKGEFVVVLGPSGCGKTTLLNIIGALDIPTSGKVQVAGYDLVSSKRSDLAKIRRSTVSFVFQSFNLFPGLTAGENVQFGIDVSDNRSGKLSEQVLSDDGLGDRGSHFPHELSGGEQQRVAIARALATANPVLLADEPTGELDSVNAMYISQILKDISKTNQVTIIAATSLLVSPYICMNITLTYLNEK